MNLRLPRTTRLTSILAIILCSVTIISCQRELHFDKVEGPDHNIVLQFKPVVQYDSVDLKFGTTYKNAFKENFTPKAFKFYIHDIQLINTDSNKVYSVGNDKYYLVDFADSLSTVLKLVVLPYKYNRIAFTLGVDSARNVSGAQTDALDPAKGMFWVWKTGYIMAKLEGTSPNSSAPSNTFEYHIGGFTQAESVIKKNNFVIPLRR